MTNNRSIGKIGEDIAANYLVQNGYTILERNKHFSRNCEIDIIALDSKKTLVCIEVKTRNTEFLGSPLEAITRTKLKNIKTGLFSYIQDNSQYKNFRIDAISIVLNPEQKIQHIKNIS